jgi:hypothetical protein
MIHDVAAAVILHGASLLIVVSNLELGDLNNRRLLLLGEATTPKAVAREGKNTDKDMTEIVSRCRLHEAAMLENQRWRFGLKK